MRLICPHCRAQYEVPSEVIPDEGRDVQCSSCGTTWFETHADAKERSDAEPSPAPGMTPAATLEPDAGPAESPSGAELRPDVAARSDRPADEAKEISDAPPDEMPPREDDADTYEHPAAPEGEDTAPGLPRARQLDPGVAEVLREEASREARRRASEGASPEPAPERGRPGLPDGEPDPRAVAARERMAKLRGQPKDEAQSAQIAATERARAAASSTGDVGGRGRYDRDDDMLGDQGPTPAETASRRVLFPDVDEINQSLRPAERRRPTEEREPAAEEARGAGFGTGFLTVIAFGAVLLALYLAAPWIADAVPALADPLAAYVAAVNAARIWLDAQVTALSV